MELLARVEAVLRCGRSFLQTGGFDSYQFGEIAINFKTVLATKRGREIELTPREFKTLKFFYKVSFLLPFRYEI